MKSNQILGLCEAQAAVEKNTFYVPPTMGPGLSNYFQIGDWLLKAGDTFSDDFIFNTPPVSPQSSVSFFISSDLSTLPTPNLSFSDFSLSDLTGTQSFSFGSKLLTPYAIAGSGLSLSSGTYDLHISGTVLVDNAVFTGVLSTNPVPEPSTWVLTLAGLLGMGLLKRRRLVGPRIEAEALNS